LMVKGGKGRNYTLKNSLLHIFRVTMCSLLTLEWILRVSANSVLTLGYNRQVMFLDIEIFSWISTPNSQRVKKVLISIVWHWTLDQ
jgi:hypothetical protein